MTTLIVALLTVAVAWFAVVALALLPWSYRAKMTRAAARRT
jgi:hypothetical protein